MRGGGACARSRSPPTKCASWWGLLTLGLSPRMRGLGRAVVCALRAFWLLSGVSLVRLQGDF